MIYIRGPVVGQHGPGQGTQSDSPKWNAAIIKVINSTCAFSAVTCQYVSFEKKKGLFTCLKWWSSSSWAPRRTVNDVCFSFDHLRETKYIRRQPNQTSVWFLSSHFCSGDAKRKTTDFHHFGIYVTWLLPLQGKNMEASGVDTRTSEEQKTCSAPENTKFICPNVKCLVNGTTRPKKHCWHAATFRV